MPPSRPSSEPPSHPGTPDPAPTVGAGVSTAAEPVTTDPAPGVLAGVAAAAATDAGGLDPLLLGQFLPEVCQAVQARRRLPGSRMDSYRRTGEQAAVAGVALKALLDLYLSAAWRLWRVLPVVRSAATDPDGVVRAGEVVLRAADDTVAAITDGYQQARRTLVRREEGERREFVDDLLTGSADVPGLLARAQRYGLDLAAPHAVLVVRPGGATPAADLLPASERALLGRGVGTDALVATKEGALVVVFSAPDAAAVQQVQERIGRALGPSARTGWRGGLSRSRSGPAGAVASYDEARRALDLADRLDRPEAVAEAADLLVFDVLLRDRAAAADLVESTLGGLRAARGGAEPYLLTLEGYVRTGGNASETARRLHLSVRAVTYRLARIRALTGIDPAGPTDAFALQAAVVAARALGWPGAAEPTA